jgi:hypothetical protein
MRFKNRVGKRVAEARAALSPPISQQDLIKRLQSIGAEVSLLRLTGIENGTLGPRHLELLSLAEALNTSVYWLLTGLEG